MAKAETVEAAQPAPPAKKSRKLVIIIAAAAAVVVLALAGVFLLMKGKAAAPEDEEAADTHSAKSAHPPLFVNLEPFTVNLQPENGEQYLQVAAVLKVTESQVGDEIKVYMPELRHRVLLLLSGKRASEISTPEGREELAETLRAETNDMLGYGKPRRGQRGAKESTADAPVLAVLFTSFIIQ